MQFVLSSLELLLHKIALKSFKKKQPTKSFLHWRTAEANIKWIFIVWLYRDGGGVCATTYSWQWLLFELSNENETGDYRVILQDNDKDGRALSGAFLSPDIWVGICAAAASASSASAESALNPNRDQNLDLNGPVLLVLLLTSSSVGRLFVSFRITWHWQNNGANDSSQVAKWQLSADPHFHCRPRRKPHNCPILIHFVSNFSFSLGDRVFFFFFFFCLVAVLLFVCARVP